MSATLRQLHCLGWCSIVAANSRTLLYNPNTDIPSAGSRCKGSEFF